MGNIVIALIIAAFAGLIGYFIAGLLPFAAPYANVIALIVAALAFWGSYTERWRGWFGRP